MRPALPVGVLRRRLSVALHTYAPASTSHAADAHTFAIPHEPRYASDSHVNRPRLERTPRAELKAALETRGASSRVWRTYKATLDEHVSTGDDGSVKLPSVLDAQQHRQVLRSIAPVQLGAKARARARALRVADLHDVTRHTDLSTPAEHVRFVAGVSAADAATFRRRAQVVIHNLASVGGAQVEDYNCALNFLAQDGHMEEMLVLWDELAAARAHGGPAPNSTTYNYMMFGMVRSLQQRSARLMELFGQSLVPRRRAAHDTSVGNAQRIVANASQMATQRVMKLVVDMLADDVVPNALTLDYAARLLRMTGQMPAFGTLLRLGFGVDVAHPDAVQPGLCAPTTQTLNTALLALGEQSTVSNMLSVFETITQPLAADGGAQRTTAPPNTTTFATLIKHACTALDTLFFAAALHPVQQTWLGSLQQLFGNSPTQGFLSPAERDTELYKRRTGAYQAVACYAASESIRLYRDGVAALARGLHVALPPPALASADAQSALVREREAEWRESADGIPVVVGDAPTAVSKPLVFRPPQVSPSVQTLYPLFAHASSRQHPLLLRWLMKQLDVLYVLRQSEEAIVDAAIAHVAPGRGASEIRASLAVHRARVEREISALAWLRFKRLPDRLASHTAYQRERKARRRHAKNEKAQRGARRRRS